MLKWYEKQPHPKLGAVVFHITWSKRQTTYCLRMSCHLVLQLPQLDTHTHNRMLLSHRNGCILHCLLYKELKLQKRHWKCYRTITIFRKEGTSSSAGFQVDPLFCSRSKFRVLGLVEEGRPEARTKNKLNLLMTPETNPCRIDGRALLQLRPSLLPRNFDSRKGDERRQLYWGFKRCDITCHSFVRF